MRETRELFVTISSSEHLDFVAARREVWRLKRKSLVSPRRQSRTCSDACVAVTRSYARCQPLTHSSLASSGFPSTPMYDRRGLDPALGGPSQALETGRRSSAQTIPLAPARVVRKQLLVQMDPRDETEREEGQPGK